jgi:NAD(P)H-hydrate epimerase
MIAPDFKPVFSRADMRRLDAATIAAGTPSLELMERAGRAIADHMAARRRVYPSSSRRPSLLVLSGAGNNGGDGFVVARLLREHGWDVDVALCAREPTPGSDPALNLARWRDGGGSVLERTDAQRKLQAGIGYDVVLDALYGTGLDRRLEEADIELVRSLNASGFYTLAVDVPSGLCADSGQPLGAAVVADATLAIGAAKPGLFVGLGPDHAGRVIVLDIGLLDPQRANVAPLGQVLEPETCAMWLPPRRKTVHKGDQGHVLVVGGARGKTGAVLLAARGALRAGAGLVTMGVPDSLVATTDAALVEAMTIGLRDDGHGQIAEGAWQALRTEIHRFAVAVIGPGMGTSAGASALVNAFLQEFPGVLVIDADALNVLARDRKELSARLSRRRARSQGYVVLTPHPGEMARLAGNSAPEIQQSRLETVRAFCATHAATLVLKGAGTIVSDGERTGFNTSGNPGMASAGMGDVLCGVIAALAARIEASFAAAATAVYLHGAAADVVAAARRAPGYLATEVADAIPDATAALGASVL